MELDSTKFSVTPAHEDKGAEDNALEQLWDETVYIQHLESGDGAYVIEKADFMKAMQEYASNERNRAIQECIDVVDVFTPASPQHMNLYSKIVHELSKLKT